MDKQKPWNIFDAELEDTIEAERLQKKRQKLPDGYDRDYEARKAKRIYLDKDPPAVYGEDSLRT